MYQRLRIIPAPVLMNVLVQPAKQRLELSLANLLFEAGDILVALGRADKLEQLGD